MMSFYLREAGAVLVALALIALTALAMSWATADPQAPEHLVEARIVRFGGEWSDLRKRNLVLAVVALPDGSIRTIGWPDDRRALHCRAGDTVRLVRKAQRLSVWRQGCYPTLLDPNPPAARASA